MLQEARSDGWLGGEIIGLIINNSQWIDDDTWISDQSQLGMDGFFFVKILQVEKQGLTTFSQMIVPKERPCLCLQLSNQSFWVKISGLKKNGER